MSLFGNLKDDGARLNDHSKMILEELTETARSWNRQGYDGRAIFVALSVLRHYYYKLGIKQLGPSYMQTLDVQARELSEKI